MSAKIVDALDQKMKKPALFNARTSSVKSYYFPDSATRRTAAATDFETCGSNTLGTM